MVSSSSISDIPFTSNKIELRETNAVNGNVTLQELCLICQAVKYCNPDAIFEIGTFDGRTTLNLAGNASGATSIYTLDLPKDNLASAAFDLDTRDSQYIDKTCSGSRFAGTDCESRIHQIYGDSGTFDFSPYHNSIDLVFIDGSHSYEYVLSDSKNSLQLLRDGKGIILWHDFLAWDGVTKAVNEIALHDPRCKNIVHIKGTSLAYLVLG